MEFQRLELLIGKNKLEELYSKTVLIVGVGGVGGYVAESLSRAGIGHLILVDYDSVDITNINRQIIALHSNIGKKKVDCFKDRIYDINPKCVVDTYDLFLNEDNISCVLNNKIDYIIDCCDSLNTKKSLIIHSKEMNIPIICSMGTGNKLHPEKFKICKLKNTSYDPLAKKMRYLLRDNEVWLDTMVLYSDESPVKGLEKIGTISFVPSIAGLMLSSYVVNQFIGGVEHEIH